jgi:hypothetical protein
MDTKFYHLYIDIDMSHAKNFLQSANIGEGALGFSGGHGPLLPPPRWLRAWSLSWNETIDEKIKKKTICE